MKTTERWALKDLPWESFSPDFVDPELLKIVKAAALVEYNASDYAAYLSNVFPKDASFRADIAQWAVEETQHGEALGAWAEKADPLFNFKEAFRRYTEGYRIDIEVAASIRGSKSGELVARCIVETGTSSYYSVLADATKEPVLKALCRNIVADELRHYKLFHTYLKRYLVSENLGRFSRLKIGLSRIGESEDDELAYAYYCANVPESSPYNRATYTAAYLARAYPLYKADHLERMVAMVFRACGFTLSSFWRRLVNRVAQFLIQKRAQRAVDQDRSEWKLESVSAKA